MDIFNEIVENKAVGKPFVLATIVKTSGSTPRAAGARMLVYPDGTTSGTIGGGNLEHLVFKECLAMFAGDKQYILKTYQLSETGPDATGMYCGGEAEVFMELFASMEKLVIFGGGHIGRALTQIAGGMNFRIIIVDDRPDALSYFKAPVETILTDESFSENFPRLDKNSYVVIVTHGHKADKEVLAKVIKHDCAYIGMIGSAKKIAKTYADLVKTGIEESLLKKTHAPIGLDIGAEGPYEIAVAIAAELIASQRKNVKDG
jgi:xanthine dehydrogenase accessory factor